MTKFLLAAASALLVAGCAAYAPSGARYPYGDPYGPGYGYQQPGAHSPGVYPSGAGGRCPIRTSRNWNAFVNRMPGPDARPQLIISGEVVTSTAGYHVRLDPNLMIRESYPVQAVAVLQVTPPFGPAAQVVETQRVRREWPLDQPIGSIEIVCEGETLARISQVQSAY